jgi:hypothetical protein
MLHRYELGGGRVTFDAAARRGRLELPPMPAQRYANAQLDNYHAGQRGFLGRLRLPSRPPLRLSLRARASHADPRGTLGFGFWNEPFTLSGGVLSAPNALWFFYASPPSDMALVPGVPGWGWKASSLHTGRWPGWLIAPGALAAAALMQLPGLGRPLMGLARRFLRAYESPLNGVSLADWHAYQLDWLPSEAVFYVDGQLRLRTPAPPAGPLGFVLWVDNQYAIASNDGRFGFGKCPTTEPQWLEIEALRLEALPG